jgi:hypothetical protein
VPVLQRQALSRLQPLIRFNRDGKPVVFDFTDLVHRGFRYGLINTLVTDTKTAQAILATLA